jgi:hypothetical protein
MSFKVDLLMAHNGRRTFAHGILWADAVYSKLESFSISVIPLKMGFPCSPAV